MHQFLQPSMFPPLQMCQQNQKVLLPACAPHYHHCCCLWWTVHRSFQLGMHPQDSGLRNGDILNHLHCEVREKEVQKRWDKRGSNGEGTGWTRSQRGSDPLANTNEPANPSLPSLPSPPHLKPILQHCPIATRPHNRKSNDSPVDVIKMILYTWFSV